MIILITYQYFLPAYKAGGPIQSISNTSKLLSGLPGVQTYILCSNRDLDGSVLDVKTNQWIEYSPGVKVYYNSNPSNSIILKVIDGVKPDVIFINGLYSVPYTVYPLLYNGGRKILSVRGMLHPGALSQKTMKKRIFLTAFKALGLHKKCEYHATTDEEVKYIQAVLGNRQKVWMVPNLPNVSAYQAAIEKPGDEVKLISVSLISPMKNILLTLQALKNCKGSITYHIYGPVKDSSYWEECKKYMQTLPANVTVAYKGEVLPHMVEDVLKQYHYFILPSKSENFGHAIYEALSAGKPVITSHNTPWNGLERANAGYNVNPENKEEFTTLLDELVMVSGDEYKEATIAAREYILHQYDIDNINGLYKQMFSL